MPHEDEIYDITIIGAGPVGMFAAFYAGLREMRVKVLEALPQVGGQLAVLYPEKYIYDIPGYPKILAKELVKELYTQANKFRPSWCLEERVEAIERTPGQTWKLTTSMGEHQSRTIIICAGVGAFSPMKLNVETLLDFEGKGVEYFPRNKAHYRNKKVVVVGGGDSAVDTALLLNDWAEEVYLIHRREGFRAHESSVTELHHSTVNVKIWKEIKEVLGKDHVQKVTVFDNRDKSEETLEVDEIIMNLGFKTDFGPINDFGLDLERRGIKVSSMMKTNLEGVYAAGDIAYPVDAAQLKLIATGFGQAALAVNYAKNYINPADKVFPGHSSEKRLG